MWHLCSNGDLFDLSKAYRIVIQSAHEGYYTEAVFAVGNKEYAEILCYFNTKEEAEIWLKNTRNTLNR